jgi:hypothetical protein
VLAPLMLGVETVIDKFLQFDNRVLGVGKFHRLGLSRFARLSEPSSSVPPICSELSAKQSVAIACGRIFMHAL